MSEKASNNHIEDKPNIKINDSIPDYNIIIEIFY